MNSLYGFHIKKDINESYKSKSQKWMETEHDDILLDFWRLPNENYFVRFKKDDGLEGDNGVKNTLRSD